MYSSACLLITKLNSNTYKNCQQDIGHYIATSNKNSANHLLLKMMMTMIICYFLFIVVCIQMQFAKIKKKNGNKS